VVDIFANRMRRSSPGLPVVNSFFFLIAIGLAFIIVGKSEIAAPPLPEVNSPESANVADFQHSRCRRK
jgi:hypothetical protein